MSDTHKYSTISFRFSPPFIPYGKLTIVHGDPGDGKTTLVLNIAAKLLKGEVLDSEMILSAYRFYILYDWK